MAENGRIRIEIGFDGGQMLNVLVEAESADRLEEALAGGDEGALALEASDGLYSIVLGKVAYVKRFTRESRVGFTGL